MTLKTYLAVYEETLAWDVLSQLPPYQNVVHYVGIPDDLISQCPL